MFTVNRSILVGDRPLTRERAASSRSRHLYTEPGRPVTAPETNAYATLDGARQEVSTCVGVSDTPPSTT